MIRRRATALALALGIGLAALACDEPRVAASPDPTRPVDRPHATLVLEPPELRVGDVATAVVLVSTPPGQRALPLRVPDQEGIWLLDSEALESELGERAWRHRTRIRFRPRDVGVHEWPAMQVTLETSDGERSVLDVPGRRFEVVSILPEFPDRETPFGLQRPAAPSSGLGFAAGVGVGAAAALAAVGLVALRRRRGDEPDPAPAAREPERERNASLWSWADDELEAARAELDVDPRAAANRAALALRLFTEQRFGVPVDPATTEELSLARPPLAARSRWPELVRILRELDEARFRPDAGAGGVEATRRRVATGLGDTRRFIDDSAPSAGGRREPVR